MQHEPKQPPQPPSVHTSGAEIYQALRDALAWCDRFYVAAHAPRFEHETNPLWQSVLSGSDKLGAVYVSGIAGTEPELLESLYRQAQLRTPSNVEQAWGNLLWFESADDLRLFVANGRLDAAALASRTFPWLLFDGSRASLPKDLIAVLDELSAESHSPSAEQFSDLLIMAGRKPLYRRLIRAVSDVLPPATLKTDGGFAHFTEDEQVEALWSTLFGEGALDLEQAIRLAALRLRAQGLVGYQALRARGELYLTIEARLLSARRSSDWFDRPKPGHIRAIEPEVDKLSAEDWRDCLLSALREHSRVERSQAVRLAFEYAREVYGLDAQRLRGGGRAERAIKSAINSGIRQKLLERDGAMYLLVRTDYGEPELRGVVPTALTESDASSTESSIPAAPVGELADAATVADAIQGVDGTQGADGTNAASIISQVAAIATPFRAPASVEPEVSPLISPITMEPSPVGPKPAADPVMPPPALASEPAARKPLFEQSLQELEFPTRTLNWAATKNVTTIGQLVAWNPADLANERNMGRLTLHKTRAALEEALGYTWEQAWAAHESKIPLQAAVDNGGEEEATTAGGGQGWAAFAHTVDVKVRQAPLSEVDLPTRMRTFVAERKLSTIGELLDLSYDTLREQPNLGRKSLNDTLDAFVDYVQELQNPVEHKTFLELWRAQLVALKPMHRLILSRRSGLQGPKETLEQLGAMLGISRERVRQVEAHMLERLQQKTRVLRTIRAHLDAAFGGGRAVSLELLNEEAWWHGVGEKQRLLEFVFERVLNDEAHVFQAPSGNTYVTRFSSEEFDATLDNARARLDKLQFPTELSSVSAIVQDECSRLDPVLLDELDSLVREALILSEDGSQVLGVGARRGDEVLAYLNVADAPVPVAEIEARFGRGQLPEEVLYFKRGVVGMQRHFPDFDTWMQELVPACIQILETRAAGRQWLVPDLHEELQAKGVVPEWLGHWHLASLLRRSEQVEYLGRLRVALRGSADQRLQFEDVFVQLLQEAGGPLDVEALMERARQVTDVRQATADLMLKEAPFVRLDQHRAGLVERDIPGGPEAVAEAVAAVTDHLMRTEKGLTPFQATELIGQLSEVHRTWPLPLVKSVLRSETTLRIDRSKNIGLSDWDDARCPARGEFMRREVLRAGGTVAVEQLCQQMRTMYGAAPDRPQLAALANQVGLTFHGESMRVHGADSAPTHDIPPPETAAQVGGIPAELQESVDELMAEPALDPSTLLDQVFAHVRAFEQEARVNEFVDLPGAQTLAAQSEALLARFPTMTAPQRALAQAAIRYFVIAENVEDDFDIGGLDDDKRLMNAVLEHFGISSDAQL